MNKIKGFLFSESVFCILIKTVLWYYIQRQAKRWVLSAFFISINILRLNAHLNQSKDGHMMEIMEISHILFSHNAEDHPWTKTEITYVCLVYVPLLSHDRTDISLSGHMMTPEPAPFTDEDWYMGLKVQKNYYDLWVEIICHTFTIHFLKFIFNNCNFWWFV